MLNKQRETMRSWRICFGFGLLACFLAAVPAAFAQYPTQSQVSKDGTTVMLEDYANPPLSNATHSGANTAAIDYKLQLGRVTSLAGGAGKCTARRLAHFRQRPEQHALHPRYGDKEIYSLHQIHGCLPEIRLGQRQRHRNCFHHLRSSLRKKRKILYRARRKIPTLPGTATSVNAQLAELESHRLLLTTDPVNPPAGPVASRVRPGGMEWIPTSATPPSRAPRARTLARWVFDPQSSHGRYDFQPAAPSPGSSGLRQSSTSAWVTARRGRLPGPS